MHVFDDAYRTGLYAAFEKVGATRALKEIRSAVRAGDLARANRIATAPGALSPTNVMGSQLRDLGRGGEGLATLVAHPQHGVSVRKLYDPDGGIFSPEIIRRKEQVPANPYAAKLLGRADTVHGTPVHFSEFVQGSPLPLRVADMTPTQRQAFSQARRQTTLAGRAAGYDLKDLRPVNALQTPNGQVRFIDHVPLQRSEALHPREAQVVRRQAGPAVLPATLEAGENLFNPALNTPAHWNSDLQTRAHLAGYGSKAQQQQQNNAFKRYMITGSMSAPPISTGPRLPPTGTAPFSMGTSVPGSLGPTSAMLPNSRTPQVLSPLAPTTR